MPTWCKMSCAELCTATATPTPSSNISIRPPFTRTSARPLATMPSDACV